jgi:hypothetical protein
LRQSPPPDQLHCPAQPLQHWAALTVGARSRSRNYFATGQSSLADSPLPSRNAAGHWAASLPGTLWTVRVFCFQSATICSRWTTRHRSKWQNPVGSVDFRGNAPTIVVAV